MNQIDIRSISGIKQVLKNIAMDQVLKICEGIGSDGDDEIYDTIDRISVLEGKARDDRHQGSLKNDTLRVGTGEDVLVGRLGNDALYAQNNDDKLQGNKGNDRLVGGRRDKIIAGPSNDLLLGERGDYVLKGNSGNDVLVCRLGQDIISLR